MTSLREREVAAALLLDALFGEPPAALHPTVWMGCAISAFESVARESKKPGARYLSGIILALFLPALVFMTVRRLLDFIPRHPRDRKSVV